MERPPPVVGRSNLYDCLCSSCARGDDACKEAPPCASSVCGTKECYGIASGGRHCLRCVREKQTCFSCGAQLEIVFVSMAKFNSFRRFPRQFRDEARTLLLVCRRFRLSRDVRVLLVKALSEHYHRPRTAGPRLFEGEVRDFVRVEVFQLAQSGRVYVHIFNLGKAQLPVPPEVRCAQGWTVSGGRPEKLYKLSPDLPLQAPAVSVNPGCGIGFCAYLPKYFHLEIDSVKCEFVLTAVLQMEVIGLDRRRQLPVSFALKL